MITDFFSHKIHSSSDEWPNKLVELAFLFAEFDGKIFNRDAIEKKLLEISPRSEYVRDPAKYRDEISAYPSYLGLYRLEASQAGWLIRLSETTKAFLIREEPNVSAFLRLQLLLFQYPNGMGASYWPAFRIQANARAKSLEFISNHIRLSPLRIICSALIADSQLREVELHQAFVSYQDIYALANAPEININISPEINAMIQALEKVRANKLLPPKKFEKRFHILKHTEMFTLNRQGISLRPAAHQADQTDLISKVFTLAQTQIYFDQFDTVKDGDQLREIISNGKWGQYFDGMKTLSGEVIEKLATDFIAQDIRESIPETPIEELLAYPFRSRQKKPSAEKKADKRREFADPEVTRIKRQRRNLAHKVLVDLMDRWLKELGADPKETPHIDLYAKIPDDGSFLFEMKSGGENILEQIRKGISQLYEYRFRYREILDPDLTLCLVLAKEPTELSWITEYICCDREICLCWFNDEQKLAYPDLCRDRLAVLNT
ncbi:MAG: hypothetical protein HY231_10955 [Acidobacteria bacterium]|nr:hypothetical protein [Acidobacteriota bacterium]